MNKKRELSPWEKTCTQRIRKLIDEYCDGNQKVCADKTGLNTGSVSQYVHGKNVPSLDNANKIAAAFNVDPSWIMGVDTIPPGVDEPNNYDEMIRTKEALELYERIQKLPQDKQIALQKYLQFLQSDF